VIFWPFLSYDFLTKSYTHEVLWLDRSGRSRREAIVKASTSRSTYGGRPGCVARWTRRRTSSTWTKRAGLRRTNQTSTGSTSSNHEPVSIFNSRKRLSLNRQREQHDWGRKCCYRRFSFAFLEKINIVLFGQGSSQSRPIRWGLFIAGPLRQPRRGRVWLMMYANMCVTEGWGGVSRHEQLVRYL